MCPENHYAMTKEVAADIGSMPKRKGQHTVVQRRENDVPGCLINVWCPILAPPCIKGIVILQLDMQHKGWP